MKALVDTNVILDAIAAREPFRENAEKIILLIAQEEIEGCITANSATDIYYIARKHLSEKDTRDAMRRMFYIFSILGVNGDDCISALDTPTADFEDAIMTVCGLREGVDCIISRDNILLNSRNAVPVTSPENFLREYSN
jgi:predicted nucleic acid-binding protein